MSKDIHLLIHKDDTSPKGIRFEISDFWVKKIRQEITDSGESTLKALLSFVLPESRNTRKFLHGGLIPLWIYLDGQSDYRDSDIQEFYFQTFKQEYFPEAIKVKGKVLIRGRSSKGRKALQQVTDKMIEMLVEEYGLRYESEILQTKNYEHFRDEIYPTGKWSDYFEYAKSMRWLEFNRISL